MFLVAEIILTVVAFRKGWRGWALVPGAIAVASGLLIGLAIAAAGGNAAKAMPLMLLADVACVGALIAMIKKAPGRVKTVAAPASDEAARVGVLSES